MGADFLISFTDLVGDMVLLYRCWMLWDKNYYVIILPLLSAVGGFGMSYPISAEANSQ